MASKMESRSMLSSRGHFLKKLRFSLGKAMILKDPGVEVGSQNRSKKEHNLGRHLGIDFSWILVDLGGQVGTKLGSKIDKKSIQNGIEK